MKKLFVVTEVLFFCVFEKNGFMFYMPFIEGH